MKFKITYNAPLTLTFALLCALALGINFLSVGWFNQMFACYFTSWSDPMMYLRLITYPFAHADMSHLVSNMTLLLVLGPILEERYGAKMLGIAMVVTALVAGIFQIIFARGSALVGCSGIVFMMIVLASFGGAKGHGVPLTFIVVIIMYLAMQINSALQANNISEMTHVLGALCGAWIGFKFRK